MKSAIVPILKNRQGDTSDKNNYRPIAIVTAISNFLNYICLMNLIELHLITRDNQFGFKKKHSTDLCIFTVKSVIKYYSLYNSPVYSCFLDASKAYDRVNHWTLFKKLLKRSISVIIVRILMFWHSKQEICVKWGDETSTCVTISNGVRQGSILSPTLFSIYMDDLSLILSESGIGCHIDDLYINHVFDANDLCLMAPCAIALQELIGLCNEYSVDIDSNFNATRSYCVAFTPKLYKLAMPSLHINHLPISYTCTDSIKYLGYLFTSDNSDDAEMLRQMRLLYCRSNRLIRMFNKCSQNILIRSFCTTFNCPYFWTQHKKATFSKLRVAYNNVYRKVFGLKRRSSASEMFVLNNISNFEALMRKSIFAFTTRLSNSKKAIICTIQRSWVIRDLIWKVWTDKLYI